MLKSRTDKVKRWQYNNESRGKLTSYWLILVDISDHFKREAQVQQWTLIWEDDAESTAFEVDDNIT